MLSVNTSHRCEFETLATRRRNKDDDTKAQKSSGFCCNMIALLVSN